MFHLLFFFPNFGCAACAIASALPLCRLCRRRCRWLYIRFALFLFGFVLLAPSLLRAVACFTLYAAFQHSSLVFIIYPFYALCCHSCARSLSCRFFLLCVTACVCVCIHTCVRCLVQDACLTWLIFHCRCLEFALFVWAVLVCFPRCSLFLSRSLSFMRLITLANTLMDLMSKNILQLHFFLYG